jgi:5'-nucleotidase
MFRDAALLCVLLAPALASAQPVQITLLHLNDTHSRLEALPQVASLIVAERARDPQALLVHAGDLFHGDPMFNQWVGVPELQMLQGLGLAAMAVGNHEYQFGPVLLAGVLQQAWPSGGSPLLSSNSDLSAFPPLTPFIQQPFVVTAHGVKVGFFGLTTPYDLLEQPAPVALRAGPDLIAAAGEGVAALKAQGAQVIVCLAHLGMPLSRLLAASVPGIDLIVNGHDHVALAHAENAPNTAGGTTAIVSAGAYYRWLGRVVITVDGSSVSVTDSSLLDPAAAEPLPSMQATVEWLKLGVAGRFGDLYAAPIAFADAFIADGFDASHARRDTPAGNLLTDACRARTGTQVAVEAAGFLDNGLPAGDVHGAQVFRMNAYGIPQLDDTGLWIRPLRLATFRLTGAELVKGLEIGLQLSEVFLQISGLRFEYDSRKPPYAQVLLGSVHVGGHQLDPAASYTVTASEGVLFYLPQMGIEARDIQILPDTVFGTVRDYVEARGLLEPIAQNRIRDVAANGR